MSQTKWAEKHEGSEESHLGLIHAVEQLPTTIRSAMGFIHIVVLLGAFL